MIHLNQIDLINLKYLFISTGIVSNDDLIDANNTISVIKILEEKIKKEFEDFKSIKESFITEAFYYLKCYNYLHKLGICPRKFQGAEWGVNFSEDAILILRLHQSLTHPEFIEILQDCFGVKEIDFMNCEMNFDNLQTDIYKIYRFLCNKKNKFSDKVNELCIQRNGFVEESEPPHQGLSKDKGICLVISNETFEKPNYLKREGTEVDAMELYKLFTKLGFDVLIKRDLTYDDMVKIFEDIKNLIKEEHKMLIVFLLSHGEHKCIITSDCKKFKFNEISNKFTSSNCKPMMGKPKLFFFVCCQGNEKNAAVSKDQSVKIYSDSKEETTEFDSKSDTECHPEFSDFFFGYATYSRFLSFRNPLKGTYYIQFLVKIISENPKKTISQIHVELQKKLAENVISKQLGFQMSYHKNILREDCSLD